MKNNITNRQLFFLLLLILTSHNIVGISKIMAEKAKTASWIPILITAIFFSFVTTIIVKLNNIHKNKIICEYSVNLIGSLFSKIISFYYFIYFILILIYLILNQAIILKGNFLLKTPIWITLLISIPVFCYIAYKGFNTIARMFEIFGTIYIVVAISVHLLMISQGNIQNILPIYNPKYLKNYILSIKDTIFSFLGMEILLFIPFNKKNGKKSIKQHFGQLL